MPDDHSPLEPHLPIPNRTVKRWRADDSTDYPCESRSLSGTYKAKRPAQAGRFVWAYLVEANLREQVKARRGGRSQSNYLSGTYKAKRPTMCGPFGFVRTFDNDLLEVWRLIAKRAGAGEG
jgi:hypothetical protein